MRIRFGLFRRGFNFIHEVPQFNAYARQALHYLDFVPTRPRSSRCLAAWWKRSSAGGSIVFTQRSKSLPGNSRMDSLFSSRPRSSSSAGQLLIEIERLQFFQLVLDVVQIRLGLRALSELGKRSWAALNAA